MLNIILYFQLDIHFNKSVLNFHNKNVYNKITSKR